MKFVEINWKPDERTLRQFGVLCLCFLPIVGWSFSGWPNPLHLSSTAMIVIGSFTIAGAVLAMVGFVFPRGLKWVFIGLSLAAMPIGMVVGEVLMASVFFGLFTPIALFFRLIGRDALERKLEPAAATYWRPKEQITDRKRYFRQS